MKSVGQIFIFCILKTFTRIFSITFCLALTTLQMFAQTSDDFSDGDLSTDPVWSGNTGHFLVVDGTLRLNAPPASGDSYLSTSSALIANTFWEAHISLDFNPSSSNFCRFFLVSDIEDFTAGLEGYFVQVGSSADDVSLYRQSGKTVKKIIDGEDGLLNSDRTSSTVRVERSGSEWTLLTRMVDGSVFTSQGVARDSVTTEARFAGLQCVYTSTRSDKFAFDDIVIGSLDDTSPPTIRSVAIVSPTIIDVFFSEPVDPALATWEVDDGIGPPIQAETLNDGQTIRLTFQRSFPSWKTLQIAVSNVSDLHGNVMTHESVSFTFEPKVVYSFRDVLVTEFLADPSPSAGLPEAEFVELYNRSSQTVPLKGWRISDGSTTGTIAESFSLHPNRYVILAGVADTSTFASYGDVIGVSSMPSLNNAADWIIISDADGRTIDSLRYESNWYSTPSRREGGWSLEIIDPDNICSQRMNWTESQSERGGTPGQVNSVDADKPDLTGPGVVSAYAIFPDTIRIVFDEGLSKDPIPLSKFSVSSKEVISVTKGNDLTTLELVVFPSIRSGEAVEVVMNGVTDCAGNELLQEFRTVSVALPEPADSLDVVINEVLFDPLPGSPPFIEVFNASNKFIDLNGWVLGRMEDDGSIRQTRLGDGNPFILGPGFYVAFTPVRAKLLSDFPSAPGKNVYEASISLRSSSGSIGLMDATGRLLDMMRYADGMHSVFLQDSEGVSLERISHLASSMDHDNWVSAAASVGYGTPAMPNSNRIPEASQKEVALIPEIFSPGTAGEFTTIRYNFPATGYVASVSIVDQRGHTIRTIAENELIGTEGFFRWDGDRDDGTPASIGNYMVRFQVFNSQGVVKMIRKRVAVAAKF